MIFFLKKAFAHREVRVIASEDALIHPHNSMDVEIIKLHGCAKGAVREIILTHADYDWFLHNKPKLAQRLRESFINRSILFLGYSCHDPSIQSVMTQAYQMMGELTLSLPFLRQGRLDKRSLFCYYRRIKSAGSRRWPQKRPSEIVPM